MKKIFSVLFLVMMCALSLNAAPKNKSVPNGKYVGQYDESLTPENSVVIIFAVRSTTKCEFKQINPAFDADVETFDGGLIYGATCVFKPCKPGARYMLTKLKGSEVEGNERLTWNMEFNPDQQVFVFDVPKKPGVYILDSVSGLRVARKASEGKAYDLSFEPSEHPLTYAGKDNEKLLKEYYGNTPWFDAFITKRDILMDGKTVKQLEKEWKDKVWADYRAEKAAKKAAKAKEAENK